MCGILGVINFENKKPDRSLVKKMRDTMYHRGPDDAGLYIAGSIALAHRRLSIIDLSDTGHQPMMNEDNSLVLICNGEIYNYVELRTDLKKAGHIFRSSSDSEVILHQYEEEGEKCLEKFNGMFAFILWDKRKRKIFAARDRLGIKPLYYYLDNKRVIFASEIKAIIEDPSVYRKPDVHAIADYFFIRRAIGNKTMFEGIKELEPGFLVNVDISNQKLQVKKYWDVEYNYNYSRSDEELGDQLYSLLDDAVKIHCRSDAPLGCHLSGGLDSSTVTAFAGKHRKKLKTFSIKFSDDQFIDETSYAKAVARHIGCKYYESSPTAVDLAQLFPYLLWHMDTPMITDGGFAYYTVSKLAHQNVKVTLTGHGGDEIFAGYRGQFNAAFGRTDMFVIEKDPRRAVNYSPGKKLLNFLINNNLQNIYTGLKHRIFKPELSFEDLWVKSHCSTAPENNPGFQQRFKQNIQGYSPREEYLKPLFEAKTDQKLDKCLYHDLRFYLPALLHQEDRVSMSVSIESRVPLLDFRIIELLSTVPPEQKVRGMQPKYLLRKCASKLLPKEVYNRKEKFAFPVPAQFWFSKDMKRMKEKVILSQESLDRGIFKPGYLKTACESPHLAVGAMNIELWFQIFIDQNKLWTNTINSLK